LAIARYCLDTSAYSQFKRGHEPIVELIDRAEWIGMPAIGLRRLGTPLPSNDIWIAATSACAGATLLTYDEHFRRVDATASRILRIKDD
jgi:predicted nucleic acid-binding protein